MSSSVGLDLPANSTPPDQMSKNQLKKLRKRQLWEETREERSAKRKEKRQKMRERRRQELSSKISSEEQDEPARKHNRPVALAESEKQPSPVHIVIDTAFNDEDKLMKPNEIVSLANQITRCYAANRTHRCPVQLTVCGLQGSLQRRFTDIDLDYRRWNSKYINIVHQQSYLDILPRDQLVYLTADSPNVITEFDESKVYIIGGLVDHNRHKGLCLRKAEADGIATARLPIGEFISMKTRKILAVKQLATEKLGTADPECITEMPAEYIQLEQKLEKFKTLYESMLRLTRNFTTSDYDPTVAESVKDVMGKFNELVVKPTQQLAGRHANASTANGQSNNTGVDGPPRTFAHALARSSSQHALHLGEHEPLGVALKKFSTAQDVLGNAKLKLEKDVVDDFVQPWRATLDFNIQNASKSRKHVQTLRLKLDTAKSALKNSKAEHLERLQAEYQKAEEEFLNAVADTSHKMRLVVDSPEPLRNLANLVKAQLEYFKTAFETMQSLHPELEELQVTQQALFRSQ